jgi:hypothetical protein
MRSLRTLFPRLALVGGAILGVVAAWPSASQAGDPFVAGGGSTRDVPASADQLDHATAHARPA